MKKPLFISFDGPKGTGKSSLINGVTDKLGKEFSIEVLVEKELDPFREKSKELLRLNKNSMNKKVEANLLELLARGRQEIGNKYVKESCADIILIDRWFPSDAVFRIFHNFEECLLINLENNVIQPDIIVATVCNPEVSLNRAITRADGLRSLVISNIQDQIESTKRFEKAARRQDWFILNTEEELSVLIERIVDKIVNQMETIN
ncbi:thymidylate kinase [Bacillus tianshenii]|uniref:Thymidylate kinase n=1 Tax=Sutcliffiella tianshenii TaxID=1463404 RepID=A0ABS2NZD2_9BACI|nr:hypothetical protein [Bacillus tianshenii]MBM7620066.1 thymidylate kinase [Bacillus tianshenii]